MPRSKKYPDNTISAGNLKPLWGVDGESAYFDASLPWVWMDGEDIVIDTDLSDGIAIDDGDEAVID